MFQWAIVELHMCFNCQVSVQADDVEILFMNSIITWHTHKKKINSSTVSAKQEVLSKLNAHFLVRAGTINTMHVILSCRTTVRLCEIIFKTKDKKAFEYISIVFM